MVALETSLAELSRAAEQEPGNPNNWYRLAEALIERSQTDDAHQALRQAAASAIKDGPWLAKIARGLARIGALHDARAAVQRAIQLHPDQFESRLVLGEIFLQAGDSSAAIVALRVAMAIAPDSPQPHLLVAQALADTDRAQEALHTVERAVELGADPEKAHRLRCRLLFALERFEAYEQALLALLEGSPSDVDLTLSLGQHYARTGRKDKAQQVLRPVADDLADADHDALLRVGRALYEADAIEAAIVCLRTATEQQPGVADAYFALGRAYDSADRLDEAIAAFETAVELEPLRADIFHACSDSLQKAGRSIEAAHRLMQAITHTKDEETRRRRIELLGQRQGGQQEIGKEDFPDDLTQDLSKFPVFDFIEFLAVQQATGILTVKGPAGEAQLGLQEGFVAYSSCPGVPSLSELAVELGYLTSEKLQSDPPEFRKLNSDAEVVEFLCRQTSDGLVSAQDLVTRQASTTLSILLQWQEGQASFHRRRELTERTDVR
ncbi:MAG: tetratricopeptide repeat protein, partial [Myxococcota bacterium]